ncbi:MAG: GntR family transcriptional regulator [Deltaproteobacteria bacterium]|nr:GntR family transcriptional regulator [Deltaproteobacteria bacterium]
MAASPVELINRRTLAEEAFDYLSTEILSGKLQAEERLVESEVAARLSISRAPVREALTELERQGLAYSAARKGVFVKAWTRHDLWEVAILRASLEALAVRLAVPHITESDFTFLEQIIEEMEEADRREDVDRLISLDFDFHDCVVERCGHKRLQSMLYDMKLQIKIFRLMTKQTDYVSYPEMHRTFLAALHKGDPENAYSTVYSHIMDSVEPALEAMPQNGFQTVSKKLM